jgi:hypothetical protein
MDGDEDEENKGRASDRLGQILSRTREERGGGEKTIVIFRAMSCQVLLLTERMQA